MRSKMILLSAFIVAAVSCNNGKKVIIADSTDTDDSDTSLAIQASPNSQLDVKPISGYFLKNTIQVSDSLTFWIIDNQAAFDSLFGMAKTMNNTVDKPDFGTSIVVAATMPPTYYGTEIQLASATADNVNNNAALHFVATGNPAKGSASMVPLWLGAVPKTGKRTFKLFTGDNLTKTITAQQ